MRVGVKGQLGPDSRAVQRRPGERRHGLELGEPAEESGPEAAFPVAGAPAPVTFPVLFANILFLVLGDISHMCHGSFLKKHPVRLDSFSLFLKPTSCLNPNHDAKHKSDH